MSSPIHHADDVDAALVYAPPWARRQSSQPPQADAAPPRSLLRWHDDEPDQPSGNDLMGKLQRQMALAPDKVPEPPLEDERGLPWPLVLRVGGAIGLAAALAWFAISVPERRAPHSAVVPAGDAVAMAGVAPEHDAASDATSDVTSDPLATPAAARLLVERGLADAALPAQDAAATTPLKPQPVAVQVIKTDSQAPIEQQVATLSPLANAPTSQQPPDLQLGADEIAVLIKRGKDAFNSGDIASARLLLRRAAEAGNGEAAMMLGGTFDPLALHQLGAIGAKPDPAQARQWYQRAVALGAAAAADSLAKLDAGGR